MTDSVAAGGTITVDAFYRDGTGQAVTPTSPLVSIIDPDGVTQINNATPTLVALGRYDYDYPVPITGPLGIWTARWTGIINGSPVQADDLFTVVAAGDITFDGGPATGPCAAWAASTDIDATCLPDGVTADQVAAKLDAASDLLYRMTGNQWPGVCTSPVIRPCGTYPDGADGGPVVISMGGWGDAGWWVPAGVAGTLAVNCLGGGSCGCLGLRQILLPGEPVIAITEVKIDGEILASSAYRVDNWRHLVRTDGGTWPCCQQAHLDDTETGTWSVVFTYGSAPPASGLDAAVALAVELAKACAGGDCALPANAVRASRNGVEFDLSPADLLTEGRTGIFAVDIFLQAANPNSLTGTGRVRSPELATHRSHE